MKKLYVLCLVTLAAVFIDVAFFHSGTVSAQIPTLYKVEKAQIGYFFDPGINVVGFSCVPESGTTSCYVLTAK